MAAATHKVKHTLFKRCGTRIKALHKSTSKAWQLGLSLPNTTPAQPATGLTVVHACSRTTACGSKLCFLFVCERNLRVLGKAHAFKRRHQQRLAKALCYPFRSCCCTLARFYLLDCNSLPVKLTHPPRSQASRADPDCLCKPTTEEKVHNETPTDQGTEPSCSYSHCPTSLSSSSSSSCRQHHNGTLTSP